MHLRDCSINIEEKRSVLKVKNCKCLDSSTHLLRISYEKDNVFDSKLFAGKAKLYGVGT